MNTHFKLVSDQAHSTGFHRGFTLIELMIVIAIIAIVLTLALPVYTDYTIRAKISEALSVSAAAKTAVAATCLENPTIPAISSSNIGYEFQSTTPYIASISMSGPCTQPVISIQTRNTGASPNPIITLTGQPSVGSFQFTCATSGPFHHVPFECRNAVAS